MAAVKKRGNTQTKFTKEQLLNSKQYAEKRDVLAAVLADEKAYSLEDADKLIEKFMKGKVK